MNKRITIITALLLFVFSASSAEQQISVFVSGLSGPVPVDSSAKSALVSTAVELIESSNFDSLNHPDIVPTPTPQEWIALCSEPCLELNFASPATLQTIGGPVTVSAVRISLSKDHVQARNEDALLRFAKYSGVLWIKLRNASGVTLP